MVQLLPKLKEVDKHLSFLRKVFTKNGLRHILNYVNGLICLNKKTIKKISEASPDETNHAAIQRILNESESELKSLEERLMKKIVYYCKGQKISLIIDDTLVERNGKKIEEIQSHYNHSDNDFITGHQFFTALVHTNNLQLPLFPQLYSKSTDSKIDMARKLIDKVLTTIKIDNVIVDSWYSDKKLIKKCMTKGIRVSCIIKTNRRISLKNGEWESLDKFSKKVSRKKSPIVYFNDKKYKVFNCEAKLNGVPFIKLVVTREWDEKKKRWGKSNHLISTFLQDSVEDVMSIYSIRWCIEVYHRDIKQNLGFASAFLRKKEGIVGHTILVALAYAALRLFMHVRGISMSIGECCLQMYDKATNDFLREIILIDDKKRRIKMFEELFINKNKQV